MSIHDQVVCRSFGDEPLVRRIWSMEKDGVLLCTEEGFIEWQQFDMEPTVALATFDLVYKYDERLVQQLKDAYRGCKPELKKLWKQAEPVFAGVIA